jgi:CheY-like chemotaxis protein
MDVQLDSESAWEALESLKSSRATRDMPVIVCSAVEGGGRAISLGASAFLPKPTGARQVLEILERLER